MRDKIHDQNEKNKTTNEPGDKPERSTEETAAIRRDIERSGVAMLADDDMDRIEEALRPPGEAAPAITEEELVRKGLTALAYLRAKYGSEGAEPVMIVALDKIERALQRRTTQRDDDDDTLPASARRRTDGSADDDEAPTSRMTPPAQSRFALRDDGALLLSLEDADDRDLEGRTVIPFMVMTGDEAARAREVMDLALSDAAAHVIGALPMKVPT